MTESTIAATDPGDEPRERTPEEWQKYWSDEMEASQTPAFKRFLKRGKKVDERFRDDSRDGKTDELADIMSRLNLFNSNITMLMSMLYGRMPKVEVSRRFADAKDDASRVASIILTRIMNTDIEVSGEDMTSVFRNSLQDRLLPGFGNARVQYQFREEEVEVEVSPESFDSETGEVIPAQFESQTQIVDEWTDTVYTHWQDTRWSPARTHAEIRWKAYRSYLTKAEMKRRFKDVDLKSISFDSQGPMPKDGQQKALRAPQAEVWEIWDKTSGTVFWWVEGAGRILDKKEDPLELDGFWSDPVPMTANVTTSQFLPKSDFDIAADLYRQIDELETRITLLVEGCRLVGAYDKNADGLKRIFSEGVENQLIPVDNWAAFAEKGGIKGSIEWVPIKEIAEVIGLLTEKQSQKIAQLQQVTGMGDVMRGAASGRMQRVSATADKLETQFGSIRIEALQNEFARWVNDTQSLKAEIISKHYQPHTIRQQSNIDETEETPEVIDAAIALIKDYTNARWRITVRPETLAIADYAQLKQDRTEFLMGIAQFMQSAGPLLELFPPALPFLMKIMKWFMAGFRGASEIEGIFDQALAQLEKQPPGQNDKPDPEAQKAQMEMQLKEKESQARMLLAQQESQLLMQQKDREFQQKLIADQQKFDLERQRMEMEMANERERHAIEMRALSAKLAADAEREIIQAQTSMAEKTHAAKVQVRSRKQANGGSGK